MTELEKAKAFNLEIKEGIQSIFNELNHGQQKKLWDNEKVRPVLERYGIGIGQ